MVVPLSRSDADAMFELQHDFDGALNKYREKKKQELAQGKSAELENEYESLQRYIDGCARGEIPDILINIQFAQAKCGVLETILKKRKSV